MSGGAVVEGLVVTLPAWLALGAAWLTGWRLRDTALLRDERWLPGIALLSGVALGFALLAASPLRAEFAPGRIFAADAIWAAPLGDVMLRDALPGRLALGRLGAAFLGDAGHLLLALGGLAGLLPWLAHWGRWRGLSLGRAAAAFALLVLASALATHLLAHVGAWGVRRLGFWTFLVALVAFQFWRQHRRWALLRAALMRGRRPWPALG